MKSITNLKKKNLLLCKNTELSKVEFDDHGDIAGVLIVVGPSIDTPECEHSFLFNSSTLRYACGKAIHKKVKQKKKNDPSNYGIRSEASNWVDLLLAVSSPCNDCLNQWNKTFVDI